MTPQTRTLLEKLERALTDFVNVWNKSYRRHQFYIDELKRLTRCDEGTRP